MVFLPQDPKVRSQCEKEFERIIMEEGQEWLGWRTVPVDDGVIGEKAKKSQPYIRQIIIGKAEQLNEAEFERTLYMIRKIDKKEFVNSSSLEMKCFMLRVYHPERLFIKECWFLIN